MQKDSIAADMNQPSVPSIADAENDDMALPVDKTCGDCRYYEYCWNLFGCKETATRCDWSPSRFRAIRKATS